MQSGSNGSQVLGTAAIFGGAGGAVLGSTVGGNTLVAAGTPVWMVYLIGATFIVAGLSALVSRVARR
jgi:hypothetical protein